MAFGISRFFQYFSVSFIAKSLKRQLLIKKYKEFDLNIGLDSSIGGTSFGKKVYIGNNVSLVNSSIGDHSYINSRTRIRDTYIGKYCSIASDVKIVLGYHPTNLISLHPAFYSNNKGFETFADKLYFKEYKEVFIGSDVWIGEGVVIPGGISIGDGAIIASGSIVTKDVEPYSVVGGVPARHIKYRFTEGERKLLLAYKWWDKEEAWLRENYKLFLTPEHFFKSLNEE
jgi:acetyltransferase-like isoleucine patch superfamily enzyme